jgi:hypothetical protein
MRLAKGWRKCERCRGHGAIHNGWVTLTCHRCIDGLTTDEREISAANWEMFCSYNRYDPTITPEESKKRNLEADRLMVPYRAAREHDYDYDYFGARDVQALQL